MEQQPWSSNGNISIDDLFTAVRSGRRPFIDPCVEKTAPKGFVELMKQCWHKDAKSRPNIIVVNRDLGRLSSNLILKRSQREREEDEKQMSLVANAVAHAAKAFRSSIFDRLGQTLDEIFSTADEDGDGVVSLEELQRYMEKNEDQEEGKVSDSTHGMKKKKKTYDNLFENFDNSAVEIEMSQK